MLKVGFVPFIVFLFVMFPWLCIVVFASCAEFSLVGGCSSVMWPCVFCRTVGFNAVVFSEIVVSIIAVRMSTIAVSINIVDATSLWGSMLLFVF
jgi:hypothetical protein